MTTHYQNDRHMINKLSYQVELQKLILIIIHVDFNVFNGKQFQLQYYNVIESI